MTAISKHITALIHLHDCVIVPGLGAFVANFKPAQVIAEQGLFIPPKKEIGFNRVLTHSDGLLFDYIARTEKISYYDAQKRIEEYVAGIYGQLNNKLTVKVDEIGEIKKDAAGNMMFIPNTSALFLPEAYGLSSFHVKIPTNMAHYDRKSQLPLPRSVFQRLSQRKLAASIALFTGLFLLNTELQTPKSVSSGSMISLPELSISNESETPTTENIASEAITSNETALSIQPENKAETVTEVEKVVITPSFFLIAGSFPEINDAQQFKEKMKHNGYNMTEIITVNGKNRVAVEGFATKEEAQTALSNYRKIKGFEAAWILKHKQ